uniref:RING-type E3 ubiquitin transferase n=1 Tax=Gossypium raimondii TaxID=29730 RepID=A0A0D2PR40_GOSRA|nr:hypothetical protein B456_005G107600 [Gossypium raimondii]
MLPSLPSPFLGITILVMIYLVIFYLLSNDKESSKEDNESGLSMEEIEQLPRILPVCSHIFHTQCIDLWFLRRNICPNCRSPFKPVDNNIV